MKETTYNDILAEIESMVRSELDAGHRLVASWVTQAIVSSHSSISGDDVAWHRCLAFHGVRKGVRDMLRRYRGTSEETDPQILLPGFDRLQVAYLIERKDEQELVPLDRMTDGEIEAKAHELEVMAAGCVAHARELRRYRQQRTAA